MFFSVAVIIVLIGYAVVAPKPPSVNDAFAQCLTEKGVKMYGAWWCPHCQNQKKLFGTAFQYVDYIECSDPGQRNVRQVCIETDIKGYPTWVFADKSRISGEATFQALADKTGCAL